MFLNDQFGTFTRCPKVATIAWYRKFSEHRVNPQRDVDVARSSTPYITIGPHTYILKIYKPTQCASPAETLTQSTNNSIYHSLEGDLGICSNTYVM